MKFVPGFTLTQLLLALSILAITLVMAIPNFYDLIERNRANNVGNQLLSTLNYARYESMSLRKTIIWCGSQDKKRCSTDWAHGQIIFIDRTGTHEADENNELLRVIDSLPGSGDLTWQGFQSERYLQFTPYTTGMALDGRFTYNSAKHELRYQRQVIVNRLGRGRKVN